MFFMFPTPPFPTFFNGHFRPILFSYSFFSFCSFLSVRGSQKYTHIRTKYFFVKPEINFFQMWSVAKRHNCKTSGKFRILEKIPVPAKSLLFVCCNSSRFYSFSRLGAGEIMSGGLFVHFTFNALLFLFLLFFDSNLLIRKGGGEEWYFSQGSAVPLHSIQNREIRKGKSGKSICIPLQISNENKLS